MEEQNKGTLSILLAGLPGVGKKTIKSRFKDEYKLYKDRVKSSKNLSTEDEILRDNLKGRSIELTAVDILGGQGLEYSSKKDISSYDIVAIVFDLGEKDSIKRVAQTILLESQLNFKDLKSRCLKALWGNKKDLFKYFGNSDELTAQMYMKLKADYQLLSYVKSSSMLNNLNNNANNKLANNNTEDAKSNEQQSPASNISDDPFKCVCQLIDDYFEKTSSQGQSIKSTSQDLAATNQSDNNSSQGYQQQERDGFVNHMKKKSKNRTTGNNNLIDSGTSFSRKREKPFPCIDGKNNSNKKGSCIIF